MSYLTQFSTRNPATPQSEQAPGTRQVQNSAGGYVWELDSFGRMHRFLVLGNEGGSYYAGEPKLTRENAQAIIDSLDADAVRAIDLIVEMGTAKPSRIPKHDTVLFALALAASHPNESVRRYALSKVNDVVRTGTHLFTFLTMIEQHRGWGRSLRRAVGEWYAAKTPDDLAYQFVKYRQRVGMSTRDPLRLAHPARRVSSGNPTVDVTSDHEALFDWVTHDRWPDELVKPVALEAFLAAQASSSPRETAELVMRYGNKLPREAIKSEHLTAEVWQALITQRMPMTALIRNLGNMTRLGAIKPLDSFTQSVVDQISDEAAIINSRVHPIDILKALRTYQSGHGFRGSGSWNPISQVVDALDAAFYTAFGNVETTGKRFMLALDVSASMTWDNIAGVPGLTPRDASAAMSLVTAAREPRHMILGFSHGLTQIDISPRQRLGDAIAAVSRLPHGGTDCSLPMIAAIQNSLEVDVFVVYTDSETWAGRIHPFEALKQYRQTSGINAKLIVNGMVANGFTIADPRDPGMLDVVGFDSGAVQVMAEFAK